MEHRSSIAIYQKSVETEDETQPFTPNDVFEAAKEVAETKGTKIVRSRLGIFVITYSETGPFNEPHLSRGWLPVHVYVMRQWASGGIRDIEMEAYEQDKRIQEPSHKGAL